MVDQRRECRLPLMPSRRVSSVSNGIVMGAWKWRADTDGWFGVVFVLLMEGAMGGSKEVKPSCMEGVTGIQVGVSLSLTRPSISIHTI